MALLGNIIKGTKDFFAQGISKIEAATGIGRLIKEQPAALLAPLAPIAASLPAVQTAASSLIAAVPKVAAKAASTVGKAFSSLSLTQKAVAVPSALVAGGILKESATARKAVAKTPSGLVNIGSNVGKFIENPSIQSAARIAKENPVLTGVGAGIGALLAAPIIGKTVSTVANIQNTEAVAANTESMIKAFKERPDVKAVDMGGGVTAYTTGPVTTPQPLAPTTSLPPVATAKPKKKAKKKKKKAKKKKKSKKKTTKKRKKKKKKTTKKRKNIKRKKKKRK